MRRFMLLLLVALACTRAPTRAEQVQMALIEQITNPTSFSVNRASNVNGKVAIQGAPYVAGGMIIRYAFIQPTYRDSALAKAYNDSVPQVEQGGCVTGWSATEQSYPLNKGPKVYMRTDSVFWISELGPNQSAKESGLQMKVITCAAKQPQWHQHPPQTCTIGDNPKTCVHGGWEAYQCSPSANDLLILSHRGAPFDMVRCGPNQWAFYFFYGNWNTYERDSTKVGGGNK